MDRNRLQPRRENSLKGETPSKLQLPGKVNSKSEVKGKDSCNKGKEKQQAPLENGNTHWKDAHFMSIIQNPRRTLKHTKNRVGHRPRRVIWQMWVN